MRHLGKALAQPRHAFDAHRPVDQLEIGGRRLEQSSRRGDPYEHVALLYNLAHIEAMQGHHAEARVAFIREVSARAVAEMHARQLGGIAHWIRRRIEGGVKDSYDPDFSYALLYRDQLVGALLGRDLGDDVAFIDAIIV